MNRRVVAAAGLFGLVLAVLNLAGCAQGVRSASRQSLGGMPPVGITPPMPSIHSAINMENTRLDPSSIRAGIPADFKQQPPALATGTPPADDQAPAAAEPEAPVAARRPSAGPTVPGFSTPTAATSLTAHGGPDDSLPEPPKLANGTGVPAVNAAAPPVSADPFDETPTKPVDPFAASTPAVADTRPPVEAAPAEAPSRVAPRAGRDPLLGPDPDVMPGAISGRPTSTPAPAAPREPVVLREFAEPAGEEAVVVGGVTIRAPAESAAQPKPPATSPKIELAPPPGEETETAPSTPTPPRNLNRDPLLGQSPALMPDMNIGMPSRLKARLTPAATPSPGPAPTGPTPAPSPEPSTNPGRDPLLGPNPSVMPDMGPTAPVPAGPTAGRPDAAEAAPPEAPAPAEEAAPAPTAAPASEPKLAPAPAAESLPGPVESSPAPAPALPQASAPAELPAPSETNPLPAEPAALPAAPAEAPAAEAPLPSPAPEAPSPAPEAPGPAPTPAGPRPPAAEPTPAPPSDVVPRPSPAPVPGPAPVIPTPNRETKPIPAPPAVPPKPKAPEEPPSLSPAELENTPVVLPSLSEPATSPEPAPAPAPATEPAKTPVPVKPASIRGRAPRGLIRRVSFAADDDPAALKSDLPARSVFMAGKAVARVGDDVITIHELSQAVRTWMKRMPADQSLSRDDRYNLAKMVLNELVDKAVVLQEAKRDLKNPKQMKVFMDQADKVWFDEEMPPLLRQTASANLQELKQKMEAQGESLDEVRRLFRHDFLFRGFLEHKIGPKLRVDLPEMRTYYAAHLHDYDRPAQVTWREVLVEVGKYPDRATARRKAEAALARILRGEDFAAVAKAETDGPNKSDGGLWETSPGGYNVAAVNAAIDSLPIGRVGRVIEGPTSYHVVRVEARRSAGPAPFPEVQDKVRQSLRAQKVQRESTAYLARLKKQTFVWTEFDAPPAVTRASVDVPMPRALGAPKR